jgi:UDP-N-acetylmuramyl pentapeptide phosphotransferase/UDP-N-acetylglucosamine-1-phosphate transferase
MISLLVAFVVSALLTLLLANSARLHGHISGDWDTSGPQKFHVGSVPRIGGIGIVAGVVAGALALAFLRHDQGMAGFVLLLCGAPAFVAGIAEDLTKNVSPRRRLLATAVAAGLGFWLLDAAITYTAIPGLDWVVSFGLGACLVTMFVVAGVANAVNIIDGFNGLSSMCVALMLASVAYVAFRVDDTFIFSYAIAGLGAVLGFFVWNYPGGRIFLGDGGAYFIGFYLAELAILLIHRHPQVSPIFALVICFYPVFETVFSIYRRRVLRAVSPGLPDGIHLHSLVYRRLVRRCEASAGGPRQLARRNSLTAPYLWALCLLSVVPAVLFWDSTPALAVTLVVFGVVYVQLYWRIVRFKAPRWIVGRR